jgi:hypothetical protein
LSQSNEEERGLPVQQPLKENAPRRDIALIWLPAGRKARLSDFAQSQSFDDLEMAIGHALQAAPQGQHPWICCDKKFVLSPEDISMAHAQFKEEG